jgi:hypothetical protein
MDEMFKIIVENGWQIDINVVIYNYQRCGGEISNANRQVNGAAILARSSTDFISNTHVECKSLFASSIRWIGRDNLIRPMAKVL